MRTMLAAFAAALLIAAAAGYGLNFAGYSSAERHSDQNVRLD